MAGGVVHGRSGTVDWEVFRRLCTGSLPAAILTLLGLHALGAHKVGGVTIQALGAVLILNLYPFRMEPARLVGTDIVHAIPLTVVAGSGHLLLGNVDFDLLGLLLTGSIPGILLGSLISTRAPETVLRGVIALTLVVAGMKMMG